MNRFDNTDRTSQRYDRAQYKSKQKKSRAVQIARALIQLAAFILIPGLFITVFSGIGAIYTAVIGGTFVLSEQLANILLVVAVLLLTFIWGRFFCGYICSFGAMQDLLRFIGKRITKRNLVPEKADRVLKYFKYAVLLFVFIAVWTLGVGASTVWSPWTVFGMYSSPLKGFPTQPVLLSIGGGLLLFIIIGSLFIDRFFCRYACPLGAIFTILSKFRIFKVKKPTASCGSCRACTKNCPMGIPLYRYDEVDSGECIDCLKCSSSCYRENVKLETLPAVSGTVAAMALAGVAFVGTLPAAQNSSASSSSSQTTSVSFSDTAVLGQYKDGTYTGSAEGYRGEMTVAVTVEGGNITDITVDSSRDDDKFLKKAEDGVIPAIISNQSVDVDTVSGATYSSRGIINAVEDAIGSRKLTATETAASSVQTDAETETPATESPSTEADAYSDDETELSQDSNTAQGQYADGVYTGSGTGFRGTTEVSVTVEGGVITDITVLSYQDDDRFFNQAQYGVIDSILSSQSVDVSTVSGATYSSNSIKEAVANALGVEFTNPNSSMGGGHGGHGPH